jgi:hypothetical protein
MENKSIKPLHDVADKIATRILEKYDVGNEQPSVFDEPSYLDHASADELAKLIRGVIDAELAQLIHDVINAV